jgi:hypothetical protein
MATLLILEPIFEADFEDCSYGVPSAALGASSTDGDSRHLQQSYQAAYDTDLKLLRSDSAGSAVSLSADAGGGPERSETDPDVVWKPQS